MIEIPGELIVIFLAMTPMGDLAIPLAITVYELSPLSAYLSFLVGSIFSIFLFLLFLKIGSRWLFKHSYFFNRFFSVIFAKTRDNYSLQIEKYGPYILTALVAIPLPTAGRWTAAVIAFVFGIPFKKAFIHISIGTMIAGLINLIAISAGIVIHQYYGWQALLSILLVIGIVYFLYKRYIRPVA